MSTPRRRFILSHRLSQIIVPEVVVHEGASPVCPVCGNIGVDKGSMEPLCPPCARWSFGEMIQAEVRRALKFRGLFDPGRE